MEENITIILRRKQSDPYKPAEILVEVSAKGEPVNDVDKLIEEFVAKAQPYKNRFDVDVYIGIWANQFAFKLIPVLISLLWVTNWKVSIDFND